MAKKKKTEQAEEAPEAAAPEAKKVKRPKAVKGLLSLAAKFGFFIGVLLILLLVGVALLVGSQLQQDLSREVSERGATVARNLAAPVAEAKLTGDTLTLAVLVKGAVEAVVPPMEKQSIITRAFSDLGKGTGGTSANNEGIARALIVDEKGMLLADSKETLLEEKYYDPPKISERHRDELFPVFEGEEGRLFYDIAVDLVQEEKNLGKVHLYMRRDVISDAVRAAVTKLIAIMLGLLLVGLAVMWFIVKRLLNPIGHLVTGVNAVASGDYSKTIKIAQKDELGDLIDAYNGMAKNLQEKEAVQEALAKYTSRDLVNQMLTDGAKLDLGGQRVKATVYFSEIKGLGALAGTMEPEKFAALVNEYLEIETDGILKYGGSIDKFIGSEVMALWGLNGGDLAENAFQCVRAAVEIQETIAAHNAKRQARGEQAFECCIGVNTGDMVSGNMGSSVKMDYTVLGANVNLGARLGLVAAKGGQTILSEATYKLVADKFKIDKLEPVPLKGIKEPVPIFWPRRLA